MAPKLIIAALAGVALLWPKPATAPIAAQQAPRDRVTVEHELIRAAPLSTIPRRNTFPTSRMTRPGAVRLAAAQTPRTRTAIAPQGVVQRAKRLLMGDGRYRPEPFPRPAR